MIVDSDRLTADILNAIVRRTYATLKKLDPHIEQYQGINFYWNSTIDHPTMSIGSDDFVVFLYADGALDDDAKDVSSNLIKTAAKDLSFFRHLETLVYDELKEIEKTLPPQKITFEEDLEEVENEC